MSEIKTKNQNRGETINKRNKKIKRTEIFVKFREERKKESVKKKRKKNVDQDKTSEKNIETKTKSIKEK